MSLLPAVLVVRLRAKNDYNAQVLEENRALRLVAAAEDGSRVRFDVGGLLGPTPRVAHLLASSAARLDLQIETTNPDTAATWCAAIRSAGAGSVVAS